MHTAVVANSHQRFEAWRSVESQQKGATLALVGSDIQKQCVLESILESAKPPVPMGFQPIGDLHYLLFSPFRYPPSVRGSRFGAPFTAGIFYAADSKLTAMAETGYWNTQFADASDGLRGKSQSLQRTLFKVALCGSALDLREQPYAASHELWAHPSSYHATWDIGARVREAGDIDMIRYASVRCPTKGGCAAVFHHRAFTCNSPLVQEEWALHTQGNKAVFMREDEVHDFVF